MSVPLDVNKNIFRAYDIRGKYGIDLDESVAYRIGQSFAKYLSNEGEVAVGRDVRPSSESLHEALINGVVSSGVSVKDIGIVPSPVLYYSVRNLRLSGGVMVTASHLTPEWNGFKFCDSQGLLISDGSGLESIRGAYFSDLSSVKRNSILESYVEAISDYVRYVSRLVDIEPNISVSMDYGNSVTALVVPKILVNLGIEFTDINKELKGANPNRISEPTEESLSMLKKEVLEKGSHIGIAYDGDGDRVAFVDENGDVHSTGNTTIPIFAEYYLKKQGTGKIVIDVTCSDQVKEHVENNGGEVLQVRVGHSYCAEAVKQNRAFLGGQYSGHMSFNEMSCTDDAIFASIKMLEIVSKSSSMSELVARLPRYYSSAMLEIPCDDSSKFKVIENCEILARGKKFSIDLTDGLKIYNENHDAWTLIRASNTSPIIRINSDGKRQADMQKMHELGIEIVRKVIVHD